VIPVDVANLAASRIDPSRCDFTVVEALWFGWAEQFDGWAADEVEADAPSCAAISHVHVARIWDVIYLGDRVNLGYGLETFSA
jgi:hypothetical protein